MKKILQKIKGLLFGKPEVKEVKNSTIVKSYTGSFEDMPPEMKSEFERVFKDFPLQFVPIERVAVTTQNPSVSPFYQMMIDNEGKTQLEEILEPELDEDEDDWGIPEEELFPFSQ